MANGQRGEGRPRVKRRDRKSVMEHNETGRARTRTLLRTWAGIAAIFFLTEFFAVVAPLRGQSPSGKAFDPFAGLQQRLEVAADEQLARLPSRSIPNAVPRGSEFKQESRFVRGVVRGAALSNTGNRWRRNLSRGRRAGWFAKDCRGRKQLEAFRTFFQRSLRTMAIHARDCP